MNASLAQFTESLAAWLVDFYLLSTLLLVLAFFLFRWIRQPVHRLTVTWIVMIELAVLAVLCAVPSWPRISLMATAPKESRTPAPTATEKPSPKPSAAPSPVSPDITSPDLRSNISSHMPPDIMSDRVLNTSKELSNKIATTPATVPSASVDPPSPKQQHETETTPWLPLSLLLGIGFLIGFGLIALWLCWGMLATAMLCRRAATAPSAIKAQLAEITRNSRLPRLLLSHRISSAAATGVLRPAILLPLEIAEKNSPKSLRAVLSHEWAHIQNHDLWLLTLGRCLLVLLYAHPFYWWLRRRIRNDQELVADAVAASENRLDYAENLLGWIRLTSGLPSARVPGAVGLWEVPSQLTRRITMLLDKAFIVKTATSRRWRYRAIGLMFLLGTACSLLTIQPARSEEKPAPTENTATSKTEKTPDSVPPIKPTKSTKLPDDLYMGELPIRVVDPDGKPVAGAKVTPFMLASLQGDIPGFGVWGKDDKRVGFGPKEVVTDKDGNATIIYPHYRDLQKRLPTTMVTLLVDHPKFVKDSNVNVGVPLGIKGPFEIKLTPGVPVEIRPLIDGRPADLDNLFLFWSDSRSWQKNTVLEKTADGTFRLPAMPPGKNSVLVVKLDGQRATHFSKIIDFDLTTGKPKKIDVSLQPSMKIEGVLSDNVPRPVRQGRVQFKTLPHGGILYKNGVVEWFSWTKIRPDGTFTIDSWPAGEQMQLIALCDGYMATPGSVPDVMKQPPYSPRKDPFLHPQVFDPGKDSRITVAMTSLVPCVATAVDKDNKPIAGVKVVSWANIGWWPGGVGLYGHRLLRGEQVLRERNPSAMDKTFPTPFQGTTDARGKVTLQLPAGKRSLAVLSDVYELPESPAPLNQLDAQREAERFVFEMTFSVTIGRHEMQADLEPGKNAEVKLLLQPAGTEKFRKWDKLVGEVLGCSTSEGRRIYEFPGIEQMLEEFAQQLREAKNPQDPRILAEAYGTITELFMHVGDTEEAAKWRKKTNEQIAKVKAQKSSAESTDPTESTKSTEQPTAPQMLKLPLRVVDPDGKPVAGAKVTPWALRSGQGHGPWEKDDKRADVGPKEVVTGKDGNATILYPRYRGRKEQIRTTAVSLFVDHPKFAYVSDLHINVPLEKKGPYEIKLTRGVPVEIRPLIDGRPTGLDNVYLFWSDGRSWLKDKTPEKTADGTLRIPLMRPGKNSVLAVKLDGQHATHFSKIVDFELVAGKPKKIDVPLQPSVKIEGVLSDNVPRPVRQGRIKIETLPPAYDRVAWLSWAPIRPDGTFTIDAWPTGERLQLIALCDGYIATSGLAPDVVKNPPDPEKDSLLRPQVFDPDKNHRITVTMTPRVRCEVTTIDENNKPIAGVNVVSCPNVCWWNVGTQIYCASLVRGERLLRERKYFDAVDKTFPEPFEGTTDAQGKITLELPAGKESLAAWNDAYELPVTLGSRDVSVTLEPGKTTRKTLHLQPAGTEKLGDTEEAAK